MIKIIYAFLFLFKIWKVEKKIGNLWNCLIIKTNIGQQLKIKDEI